MALLDVDRIDIELFTEGSLTMQSVGMPGFCRNGKCLVETRPDGSLLGLLHDSRFVGVICALI